MNIFRRPDYQSEVTRFIDQLKVVQPGLEAQQRQGRAMLWDQQIDRKALSEQRSARVPQKPYVYQTDNK